MTVEYSELLRCMRATFDSGRTRSYEFRIQQLTQLNHLICENETELHDAVYKDLKKSKVEFDMMEILQVKIDLGNAIQNLKDWMKTERVSADWLNVPNTCEIRAEPLGISLIIGAFNYPLQLCFLPVVGAIAAGNCFILKPSEMAEACCELFDKLVCKYLDNDCYRVVNGGIPETTALLKERFDHIFYTGSPFVGKVILRAAAEYLTPVTLELGGKSPVVVDGGDFDVIAQRTIWGKYSNAGQTCLAPDYVLAVGDCRKKLVEALQRGFTKFYSENPKESSSYSRIINKRHFDRLCSLMVERKVVIGGESDQSELYIAPTVMTDVTLDDEIMKQEIFGPILPIIDVPTMADAMQFIRDTREKPLAAYLFTTNSEHREDFLRTVSAGSICVNDTVVQAGVPNLPFGGVGQSGMGAYHGKASFDTFSHRKSCLIKNQALESVNTIRYPPYDADSSLLKLTKRMIVPTPQPKKSWFS